MLSECGLGDWRAGDMALPPRLTRRERDLLKAILDGCSNKEIAARHHRSVNTVKNQLAVLFQKFGVSSRLQLAVRARQLGLDAPE
ncbi:MAG TPA: LuxR C-terminal-related transcriptional regulator [Vicinamibacterales bacterium]|nr:LuxR C-terminal-related transcriptional regulator [Vicinamibacterales bacterium]